MTNREEFVLKVINFLAKIAPYLAPVVEKITTTLLEQRASTSDIVRKSISEEQRAVGSQSQKSNESTKQDKAIDDSSDIEQIIERREGTSDASPTEITSHVNQKNKISNAAQKAFLVNLEASLSDSRDRLSKEQKDIQTKEKTVFTLFVLLAVIGFLFIIVGGYLMFNGHELIGVLTEILGLISGAGSAILKFLSSRLSERRKNVASEHKEQVQVLQAIQVALAIPGNEGIQEMKKVASWLRDRAINNAEKG